MYLKVTVYPDSKVEELKPLSPDCFTVKVKVKAKMNLANNRLRELIADHFNLPVGKVKIISGHHHPHKIISLDK